MSLFQFCSVAQRSRTSIFRTMSTKTLRRLACRRRHRIAHLFITIPT